MEKTEIELRIQQIEKRLNELDEMKQAVSDFSSLRSQVNEINSNEENLVARNLEAEKSVTNLENRVNELQSKINDEKNILSQRQSEIEEIYKEILNWHNESLNNRDQINSYAQNILSVQEKVGEELAECQDLSTQLSSSISTLKAEKENWNQKSKEILEENKTQLEKLHVHWKERLETMYKEHDEKQKQLFEEIEKLLSGATSVALAGAFNERKLDVEKGKKLFAWTLIASAIGLVAAGIYSFRNPPNSQDILNSISNRTMIIAGLVMIEEFARRNYNIKSRLAESYAYKAAIAKSFQGYKKELAEIEISPRSSENEIPAKALLAETFIKKLGDEPGKVVFDKEKSNIDTATVISPLNPSNSEGPIPKTVEAITNGPLLQKITWPVVVLGVAILAAICFIAYTLKG